MRDTGGHGGSSYAEVNVPLIVIGPQCQQNDEIFKQIDMTATISILLGVPIPSSSIGTLIPNFLQNLSMEQKLYAYFYNGQRLLNKLIEFHGNESMVNKGEQPNKILNSNKSSLITPNISIFFPNRIL